MLRDHTFISSQENGLMAHATLSIRPDALHPSRLQAVIALGVIGIVGYAVAPRGISADLVSVSLSALAIAVAFVGVRKWPPLARGAWLSVLAALGLLGLGNALTTLGQVPALAGLRAPANGLFLLAYIPLFFAAFRFGRGTSRSDGTVLLDTGIVGLAAMPLVWELIVEPNLPSGAIPLESMLAIAMPIVDITLISLAAPLLLFRYSRSTSATLFVAGLVAMSIGDSIFAIETLHGSVFASLPTNVSWLASYLLIAASAVGPSAMELGAARDPRPGSGDLLRLLVLSAGLLMSPLVTLRETARDGMGELTMFAILALAIAVLVILRLRRTIGQLASADQRFRRFMDHDGFLAVIKDAEGRYVYMNAGSERIRRETEIDWYGRTDADLYPADVAAKRAELDASVRANRTTLIDTVEAEDRTWHTERFMIPGRGDLAILGVDITDRLRAERDARFQARLLESVRDAVVVVDTRGRFTYWNKGAEEMFGYTAEQMLGQDMMAELGPGTREQVESLWRAVGQGETDLGDWQNTREDGTALWLNARMSPITDEQGVPAGFLAIIKDVTAKKLNELELRRLRLAIDHANDAVIVTDGDDRVTYVNPAFERMTGFSASQVVGSRPADNIAGRAFGRALGRARASATGWRGDLVDRRHDGSDLIAQTSISPISSDGGPGSGYVTIKRDVTGERAAERAADRRARERALIAETLASLRAGDTPEANAAAVCSQVVKLPEFALATMITFGSAGRARVVGQHRIDGSGVIDLELSAERSEYLRARAAAGPWIERWIADSSHPYSEILHRLGVVAHAYAPMVVEGRPIGLLIAGSNLVDAIERLTERLPALLEFAAIATTLLAKAVSSRNELDAAATRIRIMIEHGRFHIRFQPIVDLADGRAKGYEALTRFDDGTAPDIRFQQAHELGLGLELESACLRAAFMSASALPDGAWLNVNVSPEVVLSGLVEPLLPEAGRAVVLEITEHEAITDYEQFRDAVAPIRNRVRIAVDDAGAGFASLRHIVELAPAMVKLDRSLVAGITTDVARQGVVAGMVRFAETAGIQLIAEGIETGEELDVLRGLGIPLGQGFILGGPEALNMPDTEMPDHRATAAHTSARPSSRRRVATRAATGIA